MWSSAVKARRSLCSPLRHWPHSQSTFLLSVTSRVTPPTMILAVTLTSAEPRSVSSVRCSQSRQKLYSMFTPSASTLTFLSRFARPPEFVVCYKKQPPTFDHLVRAHLHGNTLIATSVPDSVSSNRVRGLREGTKYGRELRPLRLRHRSNRLREAQSLRNRDHRARIGSDDA